MKSFLILLAISYGEQGHYETAIPLMNICEKSVSPELHFQFYFYKAVAEFQTLRRDEALESCRKFYDRFEKPPTRYDALVFQMENDLKKWGADPLADIARKMGEVSRRLETAQGGATTQEKQKKIVEDLDKLIQEAENKGKSDDQSGEDQKDSPTKKNGTDQKTPAMESIIMGEKGSGKIDDKKLRDIAKSWGTLPPKERARVVNEITRELPPKYEQLIKNYFESLNKLVK